MYRVSDLQRQSTKEAIFSKARWERNKARKFELSSFVFPRDAKDTCPVLARLSPLQTNRHLLLFSPLLPLLFPPCFRRFYSKFLPRSGIVTRQTVRKSQFPLLYCQLVFKPQIRAASGTLPTFIGRNKKHKSARGGFSAEYSTGLISNQRFHGIIVKRDTFCLV